MKQRHESHDTFGSGCPDGFYEPEGMTAIEAAERALEELREKHQHTRHHDAWCVKGWEE